MAESENLQRLRKQYQDLSSKAKQHEEQMRMGLAKDFAGLEKKALELENRARDAQRLESDKKEQAELSVRVGWADLQKEWDGVQKKYH